MADLMNHPDLIRNIAIVGHLHHGKTSFVDMLISETHDMPINVEQPERYTDTHILERERGVSIKSMPMSLVLQDLKDKSYLVNMLDTPGKLPFLSRCNSIDTRFYFRSYQLYWWSCCSHPVGWWCCHCSWYCRRCHGQYGTSDQALCAWRIGYDTRYQQDGQIDTRVEVATCWCLFQGTTCHWRS